LHGFNLSALSVCVAAKSGWAGRTIGTGPELPAVPHPIWVNPTRCGWRLQCAPLTNRECLSTSLQGFATPTSRSQQPRARLECGLPRLN